VTWFAILALLARTYSMREFGALAVSRAIIAFGLGAAAFGLNTIGLADVAGSSHKVDPWPIIWRQLCAAVATAAVIDLVSLATPGELRWLLLAQTPAILLVPFTLDWVSQARGRFDFVLIARLGNMGLVFLVTLYVVRVHASLASVGWAISGGALVAATILFGLTRKDLNHSAVVTQPVSFRRGLGAWLPSLMSQGYYNADRLLMGALSGLTSAAVYEAASRLMQAATLPNSALALPYFANFSAARKQNGWNWLEAHNRWLRWQSICSLTIVGVSPFVLSIAVTALFGHRYAAASTPAYILLAAASVIWLGAPFSTPLIALGETSRLLRATFVALILNLTMNGVLIPIYGPTGAAVATLMAELAALYLTLRVFQASTGTVFTSVWRVVVLVYVIMGGGILFLRGPLGVERVVGSAIVLVGELAGLLSALRGGIHGMRRE
jgi:O-antigen/teichoic acid export membrane protein